MTEAERLAIELLAPVEDFADPTQLEVEAAALLLKLQAENEALRSENETLRVDGDIIINRLSAENNMLHMELDAAMVDADRYQWLKHHCGDSTVGVWSNAQSKNASWLSGFELNDAIDAAMKGEPHAN